MRYLAVFFLLVLAACSTPESVVSQDADEPPRLYVANQAGATVSVIDMSDNELVATVDIAELGFGENAKPHHVAVEPDGSHWYVSLIGGNTVLKFNRDNELVGQLPFEVPGMLALDPTTDALYVGRSMSAVNPPSRIGVADRETMELEEVDVFFPRPHALALAPGQQQLYVASLAENRLAAYDAEGEGVELGSFEGPLHTLVQFAVSPDGTQMVAGGQMTGQLLFFDLSDPAAPVLTDTLVVDGMPWHPTYTPDGERIYVGEQASDAVLVVDAETHELVERIEGEGLAQPHGIAVRPDGRYVYVSNRNLNSAYVPEGHEGMDHAGMGDDVAEEEGGMQMGEPTFPGTVVVIDTDTNEIAEVIEVGMQPAGLGAPTVR